MRYYLHMIKRFKNKETEQAHKGHFGKKFPREIAKRTKMRLGRIDAAKSIEDLKIPPSHRLELLSGDRKGQHSIRINTQWRICFAWHEGNAYDVEIVDYH